MSVFLGAIKGKQFKVGDTLYRVFFTNVYSGDKINYLVKASSEKNAYNKAKKNIKSNNFDFNYVSKPITIKSEEQLFNETRH